MGAFQEVVRSPGNLVLKDLESMDVRWFLWAIFKEHRGRQLQSAGNQVSRAEKGLAEQDLLELRWTKEMYRLWKQGQAASLQRCCLPLQGENWCWQSLTAVSAGQHHKKGFLKMSTTGKPEMTLVCCSMRLVTSKTGTWNRGIQSCHYLWFVLLT